MVEFFDYRCPYCKVVDADLQKVIAADGKVRVVYKEFPILGPELLVASRAALAAVAQGKYLPFHDKLIAYKGHLDDAAIFSIAARCRPRRDEAEGGHGKARDPEQIDRNYQLADKLKIQGTPAFIIGDQLLPGLPSDDDLTAAIKNARAAADAERPAIAGRLRQRGRIP